MSRDVANKQFGSLKFKNKISLLKEPDYACIYKIVCFDYCMLRFQWYMNITLPIIQNSNVIQYLR